MLDVREDLPGERLRLESIARAAPPAAARFGCFGFFLACVVAVAIAAYTSRLDAGTLAALVGVLSILGLVTVAIAFPPREVLALDLKAGEGRIEFALGHPGHAPSRLGAIAFSDIDTVGLQVQHGARRDGRWRATPLRLRLDGARSSGPLLSESIRVVGVNSDLEIVDLLARFASIIGLTHYRVVVNDPKQLELRLTRRPEARSQPVPQVHQPADYRHDIVSPGVEAPPTVTEFDPGAPLPAGLHLTVWDPQRSIRLARRWRAAGVLLLAGCLLVPSALLLVLRRPDLLPGTFEVSEYTLWVIDREAMVGLVQRWHRLVLLITAGLSGLTLLSARRSSCDLDLAAGQARVRRWLRFRRFPLADAHRDRPAKSEPLLPADRRPHGKCYLRSWD